MNRAKRESYAARCWRAAAGNGGFTSADVLIAFTSLGVLTFIGSLSLATVSRTFSFENGTRTIAMALNHARAYAISRGHVVNVTFGSQSFSITDTEANGGETLGGGTVPSALILEAPGPASFSSLGTVGAPFTLTVHRGPDTRVVRVALTGEVQLE